MMTDLREHFSTLEDPRIDRNKRHELLDIVFAFICVYLRLFAFICVYLRLFAFICVYLRLFAFICG